MIRSESHGQQRIIFAWGRVVLAQVLGVLGFCGAPAVGPSALADPNQDTPRAVILPAQPFVGLGGDCNNAAVWVNGRLQIYVSNYPQGDFMGGATAFYSGASVQSLTTSSAVVRDRRLLDCCDSPAYGPWFESVIADKDGVLWAYYHAEFVTANLTKIHPRIGSQVSRDGGRTWQDLGIILDTPADTDELHSWLGYGFCGGNGDCSAVLDATGTYLYVFYSQYGKGAAVQGIAVARMLWADRASPVGKLQKWHNGSWSEPGLGGEATPVLANVGDAHGLRAGFDFWWGPSIHWNKHLQRYVILLNRSDTPDFTYAAGVANWYMTATSLEDPSTWDQPRALSFPDGFQGSWYPQVIGVEPGETDRVAGRVSRLFVADQSAWKIYFLRADEPDPVAGVTALPVVSVAVPSQIASLGQPFSFTPDATTFSDPDGELLTWTAGGLPAWLSFDPDSHAFSGTPGSADLNQVFDVLLTATKASGQSVTSTFSISVGSTHAITTTVPTENVLPALTITVGNGADEIWIPIGTTLPVMGGASDANGDMSEHWLEIQNPAGAWSWEGWLSDSPWEGALGGNGFQSNKAGAFTFNTTGTYILRASAVDSTNVWVTSRSVVVHVGEEEVPPSVVPPVDSPPNLEILVGGQSGDLDVSLGMTLAISGHAADAEGDMSEHWLEIQNPAGAWSWEGWLSDSPWDGVLGGDGFDSVKTCSFSFDQSGTYLVRTTAIDANGYWVVSPVIQVRVTSPTAP